MEGKRYNKNKKKLSPRKIIIFLIFIVSCIVFIVSLINILKYFIQNNINRKIFENTSEFIVVDENKEGEEDDKYNIDFAELKNINEDTIGYLKVNGTDIDCVVVKGKDNDYYLNHNFEKEKNVAGWIFADSNNKIDGTDKNIVIYGHNMRNGSMFSSLKNILTNDWQQNEDNRKVIFITENESSVYQVFSVYQIADEPLYATTNFAEGSFKEFIDEIKYRSEFNFETNADENDSILTLSTCANDNRYRVVLHAKKIVKNVE